MARPFFRLLDAENSSATGVVKQSSETPAKIDSDFLVMLTALLCALMCVLGLIAVARCAQFHHRLSSRAPPLPSAANRGVKKKILRSLPKESFSAAWRAKFSDCAICLAEFAAGDEIRVLPQCCHGFHVNCIDTWLGSHSSCPSCRQILVVTKRCQKCGGLPERGSSSSLADAGARLKEREDDDWSNNNNNNNKNNNKLLSYLS